MSQKHAPKPFPTEELLKAAVLKLERGCTEEELVLLFRKRFYHPATIRKLVRTARAVARRRSAKRLTGPSSVPTTRCGDHAPPSASSIGPWVFRRRPPKRLLLSESPLRLLERHGLQGAAEAVYRSLLAGEADGDIARRLTAVGVDSDAALHLIKMVRLHRRPERFLSFVQRLPIGELLMALALVTPLLIWHLMKPILRLIGRGDLENLALGLSFLLFFLVLPWARRTLGSRVILWRRRRALDGLAVLATSPKPPILYLRPHALDGSGRKSDALLNHLLNRTSMKTVEEKIAFVLQPLGPVVALEGPAEGLPNLGAKRVRTRDVSVDTWQSVVLGLIARSSLVVMRFRPTKSIIWETCRLLELYPPVQLVFVLATTPTDTEVRDRSWSALRDLMANYVTGDLKKELGPHDYCLGFDSDFRPRFFGRKPGLVRAEDTAIMDAMIDAAALDNPHVDTLSLKPRVPIGTD